MLTHPRLKQTAHVHLEEGRTGALLVLESRTLFLGHEIAPRLLPLLDGTRNLQAIATALKPANIKDVLGVIHLLHKEGFVVDGARVPAVGQSPYWESRGLNEAAVQNAGVRVRAIGSVSTDAFRAALQNQGLDADAASPVLEIVVTDDYLREELGAYGRKADRPWLLARPAAQEIWVGPLFEPGRSACWECLAYRLRANLGLHLFVAQSTGARPAAVTGRVAAIEGLAAHMAASHAAHWIAGQRPHPLRDTLMAWDPATLTPHAHAVTRRPQCPACGSTAARAPRPIELREGLQAVAADGGYRSLAVADALTQLQRYVSPLTGIVHRLNPVPDSEGLHVYAAKVYPPRPLRNWDDVLETERFYAGGKGTTEEQARVSALAEAIERYSARFHGEEPYTVASFAELGNRAISPDALALFSASQFANRDRINATAIMNHVPLPFDPNARIPWTAVWSFTRSEWRLLPTHYCYMGSPPEHPAAYCRGDSNGNAAGTSLEDAILQGFFELVERDAAAIWWYNRLQRSGVMLEGIDDDFVGRLRAAYAKMGRDFWLLDITSDFGLPVFVAITRMIEGPEQMCSGMGCHMNPRVAALRALTEMNQLLPHILQHAQREDRQLTPTRGTKDAMYNARLSEHPYLAPDPERPARRISDFPQPEFTDLAAAVRYCIEMVHQRGMEFLVHDLTRPDIGLPVAKVIVPGMRLHWRRLAPGRLYEVPVQLGWLARPYREDELNPLDLSS